MYCKKCGNQLPDGAAYCMNCGTSMNHKPSQESKSSNEISLPAGIVPRENEIVVRKYYCSYVPIVGLDGVLVITNRRIIYYAVSNSGGSKIIKEIDIDKCVGFECYAGRNIKIFGLLLAIVVLMLAFLNFGLLALSSGTRLLEEAFAIKFFFFCFGVILLALTVFIVYLSTKRTFSLTIYGSACSPTIALGAGAKTIFGNTALWSLFGLPGADINKVMMEYGSLIYDLQTMGDIAIEKWNK